MSASGMTAMDFAVFWFAVFGVSYTLSHLHGPFGWCLALRRFVMQKQKNPHHWLSAGIECPICVSFWVAIILYPLLRPVGVFSLQEYAACVLSSGGVAAAVMVLAPPEPPDPRY